MGALVHCIQSSAVAGYNTAFCKALLQFHDISGTEALDRYIEGLKQDPQNWVRMQSASSLDAAIRLTEWYNTMFSKQKHSLDLQNAGQKQKECNLGPNG